MDKDAVFRGSPERACDFEFNAEVAEVFDDMLVRSVPFYLEQQNMLQRVGRKFWVPGTTAYDLGCSTATTLLGLCDMLPASAHLVGYDNSRPMLEQARRKITKSQREERIEVRYGDLNGDLSAIALDNASIVTMCWTLQFVRPLRRDDLIRWIYSKLVDEGVLIVTEKILTNNGHMNRFFVEHYYEFKRSQGYSETEIMRKREALENKLIPYRLEENIELFHRNGFQIVETFFQWFNFAGFLCVKKSALAQQT
ncbi:MAG: carboxy-S-adenosyl-L-methionine synthase CmoA [Syntrophobacteraceae bacterium]|jgi:tRNA (cmo5U34)-methyltransferase